VYLGICSNTHNYNGSVEMKPLKLASAPAYSILFLTASILAMTGYSSASDDESAVALSQVNLTIDRARISDNRLEVRGETPGERDRVDIRILDDRITSTGCDGGPPRCRPASPR
jgi:hypothetical protein